MPAPEIADVIEVEEIEFARRLRKQSFLCPSGERSRQPFGQRHPEPLFPPVDDGVRQPAPNCLLQHLLRLSRANLRVLRKAEGVGNELVVEKRSTCLERMG